MKHAALIVHSVSYPYIENVALFIHQQIRANLDSAAQFLLCNTVDEAQYDENTFVFLIGENFPEFERRPGCTYIYLNFSVVTVLGQPWETGLKARQAIRYKRKLLDKHLPVIDILLDYYPPQTKVLTRQINIPVFGFDVATAVQTEFIPMRNRAFDVCFVASLNARRQAVRDAVLESQISLSPVQGIAIEDAAAKSRLCLNVHAVKSNHFETPRVVAALSAGTPVLSEPSFGAHVIVAPQYLIEGTCVRMPKAIENLLCHEERLDALGRDAQRWYGNVYLPRAQQNWRGACENVRASALSTKAAGHWNLTPVT